jgi:hypothetical protein
VAAEWRGASNAYFDDVVVHKVEIEDTCTKLGVGTKRGRECIDEDCEVSELFNKHTARYSLSLSLALFNISFYLLTTINIRSVFMQQLDNLNKSSR